MTEPLPSESTCWDLVRDAACGDNGAKEGFAERYEPAIRRYLGYRWRGRSLQTAVDDAVQEVFLEFFRQHGALSRVEPDRDGGFRPFLYGVVQNVARRTEAREARSRREVTPSAVWPDGPESDEPTLSAIFDRAWLDTVLRQSVRLLERRSEQQPDARRRVEILRHRFGHEKPYKAIAAEVGIPEAEIYREATRARDEFKRALFDVIARDYGGSPGAIERECRELLERIGSPD